MINHLESYGSAEGISQINIVGTVSGSGDIILSSSKENSQFRGNRHFKGIGQFIIVGNEDQLTAFEELARRLEAIGIKKGELSKNEKLDDANGTLFKKMFPQKNFSEVYSYS